MNKRLTTTELAKATGFSSYAITSMRKMGLLPYIKIGVGRGRIFYDPEAVNQALDKIAADNAAKQADVYQNYVENKYTETYYPGILGGGTR